MPFIEIYLQSVEHPDKYGAVRLEIKNGVIDGKTRQDLDWHPDYEWMSQFHIED